MSELPVDCIPKKWGHEEILINDVYCIKKLHINQGAITSYHSHPLKTETFIRQEGQVLIFLEAQWIRLRDNLLTIKPGQFHLIIGLTDAVILEVSTHHSDDDVIRETESIWP